MVKLWALPVEKKEKLKLKRSGLLKGKCHQFLVLFKL